MTEDRRGRLLTAAALSLAAVWLGMLIGVSFVATPIKFTAPTLELGPALNVGRVTFTLFSRLEWGLALLTVAAATLSPAPRTPSFLVALLAAILLMQAAWLLPALDERVAAVLQGQVPTPSWHHLGYALLEAGKAMLLAALIITTSLRLATTR